MYKYNQKILSSLKPGKSYTNKTQKCFSVASVYKHFSWGRLHFFQENMQCCSFSGNPVLAVLSRFAGTYTNVSVGAY